ncbi:DUF2996 domain-containing protein [Stenomitos frigidus]|uniref:DUF2996 domain-containing protein n=1 Tax=Stenomitos frigidus ULC18 TaxID=2107698 RepID=A0A2T1E060_9CYAN|nr:DUF2996 domain-containing protein [Stenomitos frigidus]PSB26143.1 DUF2996 domain-containing protein [Stenomitos frigidus ULC18]
MAEETTPNQTEGQPLTNSEAKASDLPTANASEPQVAKSNAVSDTPETDAVPKKPAAKRAPKAEAEGEGEGALPAAKAKKEKPPALEDKPFAAFIQQDFLPALQAGLVKQDIQYAELTFEKRKINVIGFTQAPECWQVVGRWQSGKQTREFSLYFFDEKINGQKGFSYSESGGKASTMESFRIDERKVDLGLLVFWTLQRLNAQKWLVRN